MTSEQHGPGYVTSAERTRPSGRRLPILSVALLAMAAAGGCGSEAQDMAAGRMVPYEADQTVVVGSGEGGQVQQTPAGSSCIELGSACVRPQEECGEGARADVVVSDGELVRTVCYPGQEDATFDNLEGSWKPRGNGAVIGLDAEADGDDITNNVQLDGNDQVLYGHGEDVSVIGGNVKIVGNGAVVRGVRIRGNLDVEGDGATISLCAVEGNVHIKGNQNVLVECEVYGGLKAEGSGHALVANRLGQSWDIKEDYEHCSDNLPFDDADGDGRIDEGELLGDVTLSCPQKWPQ